MWQLQLVFCCFRLFPSLIKDNIYLVSSSVWKPLYVWTWSHCSCQTQRRAAHQHRTPNLHVHQLFNSHLWYQKVQEKVKFTSTLKINLSERKVVIIGLSTYWRAVKSLRSATKQTLCLAFITGWKSLKVFNVFLSRDPQRLLQFALTDEMLPTTACRQRCFSLSGCWMEWLIVSE